MKKSKTTHDIIIIGAGAAGIGMGVLLEKCGVENYLILERNTIGSSFSSWPKYTRFISPSFCGNFFNAVDLNAISPDSSPAFSLGTEHPNGKQYTKYLQVIAEYFELPISEGVTAQNITKDNDLFHITTNKGEYRSKFVIWAGGEFQTPFEDPFEGSELCIHSSKIDTFPQDEYVIIGGYESGLELAAHLGSQGKKASILDAGEPWNDRRSDSSISVAPSTNDRLSPFVGTKQIKLFGNCRVTKVEKMGDQYKISVQNKKDLITDTRPILATGFHSLPPMMEDHFEYTEEGNILVSNDDESSKTPGLFLIGPQVKHGGVIFCFIYKFRQRLPIVAEHIFSKLGIGDIEGLEEYKKANMYLKDLSCCENECAC